MIKALQKKFILSAMLAVTILLAILIGAINVGNVYIVRRQNEQMIRLLLEEETKMPPPGVHGPKDFWGAPADENFKMSAVYFTVRSDGNGHIFQIDTGRIANVSEEEAAEICRTVMGGGVSEGKIENFCYRVADIGRNNDKIYLFLDTSMQLRSTLFVLLFSLTAGFVCWLAMLLLVVLLSRRAINPIAENLERQRQFVTDAGHEIKTPLAIILANTEAMELHQGESRWSRNIREQTVRLDGLMRNLLMLARADERCDAVQTETFSLSLAVSESLQMFAEPIKLKEIKLHREIAPDIDMTADKEQLQRLFSILMDNAVKYSVPGGTIRLFLGRQGKSVVFRIGNLCEKLPACEPEKLFDRFYRDDAARTQQNGGYGIGLSAARRIAGLYGGEIKAAYQRPDQIEFTVTFS